MTPQQGVELIEELAAQSSYNDEYSRDGEKSKSSVDVKALNEIKDQISELTKALSSRASLENVNQVGESPCEDVNFTKGTYQQPYQTTEGIQ